MGQEGIALILTLVVIALLSVLVLEFNYLMRVEASMAKNYADGLKAHYLARSGINLALFLIEKKDDPKYEEKIKDLAISAITVPLGEGEVVFQVSDEGGKINVNHLKKDGKLDRKRVEAMLELCDILNEQYERPLFSYGIVAAIIDWVDADDEVEILDFVLTGENEGAEREYYENLEHPYQVKNAPFDTLRELLLVRGINEEVLYGREAEEDREATEGLSKHVTVYGDGKININTASLAVLQSLDIEIDETLAQGIIDRREEGEFEETEDIKSVDGMTEEIFKRVEGLITTGESQFFSVEAEGRVREASKLIKAVVQKKAEGLEIVYWRAR